MAKTRDSRKVVLAVAPHPDDETLGCGGTLLRHRAAGDRVHWLIMTAMTAEGGYTAQQRARRDAEIAQVARLYGLAGVTRLDYPTATLEGVPRADLVRRLSAAFAELRPNVVYGPHRGDAHGDHRVTAEAVAACAKWFRNGSVERVLAYEALSETDQGHDVPFTPDVFVDVSRTLARKLRILRAFAGELGEFPFPRSERAVRAQAAWRGATAGVRAAEAFMLLKERL